MKKVKWGVLSTANIGTKHVIPGMQKGTYSSVEAIASRGLEKAEKAAAALDIGTAYGSYEKLLADPEIEAVYIPLPNHLHVEWTIKALEAGKHVLCEKPIGLNTDEAQKLRKVSMDYPNLKVMEAFMYRFHPQWEQVMQWIREGEIGNIMSIDSIFSYYNDDPEDIRNIAEMGGGGLLDIGCYCLSASRYILREEPVQVFAEMDFDPDFEIDRVAAGVVTFPGSMATFTCSTQSSPVQQLTVLGTQGLIEMDIPFNPLLATTTIRLKKNGELTDQKEFSADHYTLQGDAFSKAIREDIEVPTPLDDAVANMKAIDALFESAKRQAVIKL